MFKTLCLLLTLGLVSAQPGFFNGNGPLAGLREQHDDRIGGIFGPRKKKACRAARYFFNQIDWVDSNCTVDDELPACKAFPDGPPEGFDPDEDDAEEVIDEMTSGVWVCRTLYNPVTGVANNITSCSAPSRGLEKDQCGCCGDCPEVCTNCPCELRRGEEGNLDGVYIQFNGENRTRTRCVDPAVAATALAFPGDRVTCPETCPDQD